MTVKDTNGDPEQGLPVYAFDGASYTGYNKTTNTSGEATFTLPLGDYRFRADKNGTHFWSGETNHCTIPGCLDAVVTTTIPLTVTVEDTNGDPEDGLSVYAFDGASYTGYNKTTGADGQAVFTLPLGDYRFRADKNGTHFWSGENNHCTIPGCTSTTVTTTIPVVVSVRDSAGGPEAGLNVYGFDDTTYSGYNGATDVSGLVTFTLPLGDYRFRADKDGTHFWSGETNHCTVPGCASAAITTTTPGVTVVVEDTNGDPEPGLPVYAFDGTTYSGYNGTTNLSGTLTLLLPEGNYRFRADKNGTQFWSGEANHCTVPGCAGAAITTTIPVVVTVEDTNGDPEEGLPVYAFDGASYSGYNETTDASGLVTMTLPLGDYRFRSDKNGTQFWSGEANHCTLPGCASTTVTTTIPLTVMVKDTNGDPEQGLPVYAFDGASYSGYNKTTNASGEATFTLPQGDYRFRSDKNGTQFWSGEANHCTLPGCASTTVTTTIPVVVTVEDGAGDPEPNLPVYAFDETTYSGYNGTTDVSGTVTLTLPAGDYRFRADKSGEQYWSGISNHCTVPGCTEAAITVGSQAMGSPAGGLASGYSLPDLSLLLLAPLAVAALGRRKRWQHWTWPLAGVLLVVAVVSSGAALAEGAEAQGSRGAEVRAPALSENDLLLAPAPAVQPQPAPRAQSASTITTTRVISYTYDPLGRLVEADYSTGEQFEYQYDAVGNRLAMTSTIDHVSRFTPYEYDAANRLTKVGGVTYTWDDRGNLVSDGTFTYTYNAAGRMVRAESVTSTLVYTYNAAGLRVAQSVESSQSVFSWDWASGLPEMLSDGDNLYLVGHDTLGAWDGAAWAYYLPDALGSVRQEVDGAGAVVSAREWSPYGVEVGAAQTGLGYTGEWFDADVGLEYLRARWYDGSAGRFTQRDPWESNIQQPQTVVGIYVYGGNNPVSYTDPTGMWRWWMTGSIYHFWVEQYYESSPLNPSKQLEYPIPGTPFRHPDMFNSALGDVYEIEPWYRQSIGAAEATGYVADLRAAAGRGDLAGKYLGIPFNWNLVPFHEGTGVDWPGKFRMIDPRFPYLDLVADYTSDGVVLY